MRSSSVRATMRSRAALMPLPARTAKAVKTTASAGKTRIAPHVRMTLARSSVVPRSAKLSVKVAG
jgi:hypothetical protein